MSSTSRARPSRSEPANTGTVSHIDIVEVGTGGGSIAWADDANGVHVGPRSAGAEPGPACYARGGRDATITDATLVLGHLSSEGELFGGLRLDARAATSAIGELADRVGVDPVRMAEGIIEIGAAAMANSVRAVTTQRGLDPRDFTLFAYGGNGPAEVVSLRVSAIGSSPSAGEQTENSAAP